MKRTHHGHSPTYPQTVVVQNPVPQQPVVVVSNPTPHVHTHNPGTVLHGQNPSGLYYHSPYHAHHHSHQPTSSHTYGGPG
jgi:hypothetical protein